jgi:hypothetical protein
MVTTTSRQLRRAARPRRWLPATPLTGCGRLAAADRGRRDRLSLGALAADWRSRFTLPLIAVTGSNGKTTTKEMIASILRAALSATPYCRPRATTTTTSACR